MPTTPTLSLVIITYQRPDELNYTLEQLLTLDPLPDEIVVLDNDPDQSARKAPLISHQLVNYVTAEKNLGVAAGRNRAAKQAFGDILVFLDDDAHFAETGVLRIIREAFNDPTLGCLAFLIRNNETKAIVPKEYPGHRTEQWQQPHAVSYFVGCGHALPRRVFTILGGFDETFFYDGEELELAFRILREGWHIAYTPAVLVYHRVSHEGRQQTGQGRGVYWLVRNRMYVAVKHIPFPYQVGYIGIWFGFSLLKALKGGCIGEFIQGLRALQTDGVLQRASAYRRSYPLPRAVVNYLRQHDGRLWY